MIRWRTPPSRRAGYKKHLNSAYWRTLKQHRYMLARGRCEAWFCRSRGPLECHHVTYKRFGRERLSDVRMLCRYHHAQADRRRRRGGVLR